MLPKVSVIVPCYNEQSTIRLLLDALHQQTYPRADMEVIISDGISQDRTRETLPLFKRIFLILKFAWWITRFVTYLRV